jgi:Fic family protein
MNLGAIQSKCEHVANAMLPPEAAKELYYLYLAKGIRATTAIEGNTLSEDEVRQRILKRGALPKSQEYQGKEIDNIVDACNEIAEAVVRYGKDCALSSEGILRFNKMILNGLPLDKDVVPGEIRKHNVGVADYRAAPHQDCAHLLDRLCKWINGLIPDNDEQRIALGVIRAVVAHLYLAWIHPFGDGNGRTARLVEVQILLGSGVPMIAAHLLSNFYNETRPEYYRQLSLTSKSGGNVLPFLEYATQGLFDRLNLQIRRIRRYQWDVAWRDYVYGKFRGKKGNAAHRQRLLALELGKIKHRKGVSARDILALTPELAIEYRRKTTKTLSRDVNTLVQTGLLIKTGKTVRANREALASFIPPRRAKAQRR